MVSLAELTGRLDTTKIRVTDGDIPAGDWIFNGHGIVLVSKDKTAEGVEKGKGIDETAPKPEENGSEKLVIQLQGKMKVIPRKAEEFGVLRQFASDMSPLAGAIGGASLLGGPFGIMTGFAAGHMLGRNIASFTCELDDGRKFNALADFKIFRRLQSIAKN